MKKTHFLACVLLSALFGTLALHAQTAEAQEGSPKAFHRWEVGLRVIPSLQRMSFPSMPVEGDFRYRYRTGADAVVHFFPTEHIYLTGGIRFLDGGGRQLVGSPLPYIGQNDTVAHVDQRISNLNLSLGAGLAFPLGERLELRSELRVMGGMAVARSITYVLQNEDTYHYNYGAARQPNYLGAVVAFGLRGHLSQRFDVEVMPMVERQIRPTISGSALALQGLGLQAGAFYRF